MEGSDLIVVRGPKVTEIIYRLQAVREGKVGLLIRDHGPVTRMIGD